MKTNNQKIYAPRRIYDIYNSADKQIILNFEKDYLAWAEKSSDKDYLLWFARLGIIKYYNKQVIMYPSQITKYEDYSARWNALQSLRITRTNAKKYNEPINN